MASALPLLLGGAALLLLMGGKKKGEAAPVLPPTTAPPPPKGSTAGAKGSGASKATWTQRQKALKYVSENSNCTYCNPGKIDGVYGPATKKAVKAFQSFAGIGVDGLWGAKTEAAMAKAIKEIVAGIIKKVTGATKEPGGTASGAGGGAATAGVKKVSGKAGSHELWASTNGMEYDIGVQWRYTVLEPWLKTQWDKYKVAEASRSEFGGFGYRYVHKVSVDPEHFGRYWDHIFDSSEPHYIAIKSMMLDIMKVSVGGKDIPLRYVPLPAQRKIRDTMYGWLAKWTKSKISSSFDDTWHEDDGIPVK